ncbi:hypothetical protein GCM10010156_73130 [Planobispora rosea]|uniref:Uncharacterized protein n=1 Tax=Planobispora rosea TaxID=35762 RepID=A0A8J3S8Z0_PLARO|nr:hypothetical protein [Planobispora rosea]GGT04691.1 hypothetical protein GCM10010156_73130 [Planobispora rosea]GIH88875.1 hypothetical protein Pro02_72830 [Planobispora rosea]
MNLDRHVTRYTFDSNTIESGAPGYNPRQRLHVELYGTNPDRDLWYITRAGLYRNHATGQWDDDYIFRHADNRWSYLTDLATAVWRARALAGAAPSDAPGRADRISSIGTSGPGPTTTTPQGVSPLDRVAIELYGTYGDPLRVLTHEQTEAVNTAAQQLAEAENEDHDTPVGTEQERQEHADIAPGHTSIHGVVHPPRGVRLRHGGDHHRSPRHRHRPERGEGLPGRTRGRLAECLQLRVREGR